MTNPIEAKTEPTDGESIETISRIQNAIFDRSVQSPADPEPQTPTPSQVAGVNVNAAAQSGIQVAIRPQPLFRKVRGKVRQVEPQTYDIFVDGEEHRCAYCWIDSKTNPSEIVALNEITTAEQDAIVAAVMARRDDQATPPFKRPLERQS